MAAPSQDGPAGLTITVPPAESGAGLLRFVSSRLIGESKTTLRRLIAAGRIRLNGEAATPSRTVLAGDRVCLPPGLEPAAPPPQSVPIEVLHADRDHLCVNKPAGLPVLPGRDGQGAEFHQSLVAFLNRDAPPGGPYERPHLVHRLDRDTSGVLLVARNAEAGRALSRQFRKRLVRKRYLALIEGVLPREELTVELPIGREPGSAIKMRADPSRGKPARTELAVAERFGHFCLLEARPLTGRQHQVRVHLSAIGYPLAVDHLYGRRERLTGRELNAILGRRAAPPGRPVLERMPLHAAALGYRPPSAAEPLTVEAPPPEDLSRVLELLRRCDAP